MSRIIVLILALSNSAWATPVRLDPTRVRAFFCSPFSSVSGLEAAWVEVAACDEKENSCRKLIERIPLADIKKSVALTFRYESSGIFVLSATADKQEIVLARNRLLPPDGIRARSSVSMREPR